MAGLSDKDLHALRRQLDEREAKLRDEVRALREEAANRPSAVARNQVEDIGELGEERMREAMRYAEQERDVLELRDIEDAKRHMDLGTYGVCIDCDKDIPLARLHAQPAAARCAQCQDAYERSGHAAPPRVRPTL
jgi:RNA polymerase-binding transcription factor DksA